MQSCLSWIWPLHWIELDVYLHSILVEMWISLFGNLFLAQLSWVKKHWNFHEAVLQQSSLNINVVIWIPVETIWDSSETERRFTFQMLNADVWIHMRACLASLLNERSMTAQWLLNERSYLLVGHCPLNRCCSVWTLDSQEFVCTNWSQIGPGWLQQPISLCWGGGGIAILHSIQLTVLPYFDILWPLNVSCSRRKNLRKEQKDGGGRFQFVVSLPLNIGTTRVDYMLCLCLNIYRDDQEACKMAFLWISTAPLIFLTASLVQVPCKMFSLKRQSTQIKRIFI